MLKEPTQRISVERERTGPRATSAAAMVFAGALTGEQGTLSGLEDTLNANADTVTTPKGRLRD